MKDHAKDQARLQIENIRDLMARYDAAGKLTDALDDLDDEINETGLSVQVRSGWNAVGENMQAEEYEILLCSGGPAVRIIGTLSTFGDAESAEVQYQDWGISWTTYGDATIEEEAALLAFAQHHYFRV